MTRLRPFLCALLAVVAVSTLTACGEKGEPGLRVVLITLDTLRYDTVFGPNSAMPQTRAWADRGVVFERFYSTTSTTQPTHATIFTGLHPWQHGMTRNGQTLGEQYLTLAEAFRTAGFSTAAVVSSFPVASRFGFGQGFDRYEEDFSRGAMTETWRKAGGEPNAPLYSLSTETLTRAHVVLDEAEGDRQFFWFHFYDPHAPYGDTVEGGPILRPRPLLARATEGEDVSAEVGKAHALYDRDSAALDSNLAALLGRLAGDAEHWETHVVVTSDHGESFGEEGSLGHGRHVGPAVIHVPTVIFSPTLEPRRRTDVAGSIDLGPTLLALAGLDQDWPGGRDLRSERGRQGALGSRRTFEQPFEDQRLDREPFVLPDAWFYAVDATGTLWRGNGSELVEADGDPAKAEAHRKLFASLEELLLATGIDEEVMDAETRARLRALGYL